MKTKIKCVVAVCFKAFVRLIYAVVKLRRNNQGYISIISRQSNHPSIDIAMLSEELGKNHKVIVITKKLNKGLSNLIAYLLSIPSQLIAIRKSNVIIVDGYCPTVSLLKKDDTKKIVQIWHSMIAIKKFAYQSLNMENGADEHFSSLMRMHKGYDYFIAPSRLTASHFAKAFNTDEDKAVLARLPRTNYLKDGKVNNDIYEKYPVLKEKINVLYAPTFRKNKHTQLDKMIKQFDFEHFNLIVKVHPVEFLEFKDYHISNLVIDFDIPTIDFVKIADKVISDYSSIVVESALIDKEVYIFAYDIEMYKQTQGLNVLIGEDYFKKHTYYEVDRLVESLKDEYDYEELNEFKKVFIDEDAIALTDFVKTLL